MLLNYIKHDDNDDEKGGFVLFSRDPFFLVILPNTSSVIINVWHSQNITLLMCNDKIEVGGKYVSSLKLSRKGRLHNMQIVMLFQR